MQTNLEQKPQGKRVIVAMSGGVDSSVAAKLLVDAGYEALGITMKLAASWQTDADAESCCTTEDQQDAQRIAHELGFEHRIIDFEGDFEQKVVAPFCRDYLAGKTPNPCVACNRYLKFGAMQNCRAQLGYDYVATGHYARRAFDERTGRYQLLRGIDEAKDQSYFLYHLSQETLAHMLFPLGECTKAQIRQLASDCGLEVADKPESQDICFVDEGGYAEFIEQHEGAPLAPGPIVNRQGDVLGQHAGLARYTIGQRKGLGVAYSEPLYVLDKDAARNALIVGTAAEQGTRELWANEVNLISRDDLPEFTAVQAKAMYRQKPVAARARVERSSDSEPILHVVFDESIRACAPGQSVVLYDGDIVVGGGCITRFA